jgi:hypothetical protein
MLKSLANLFKNQKYFIRTSQKSKKEKPIDETRKVVDESDSGQI